MRMDRRATDGQTYITKLIDAFRNFWNAPKKDEYKKGESIRVCAIKTLAESENFTGLDMRLPGGKIVIRRYLPPLLSGICRLYCQVSDAFTLRYLPPLLSGFCRQ
jgi:hypothetical protein